MINKMIATTLSISMISGLLPLSSALASTAPQFTATYRTGDHVKLEWSATMADADVITQSGFENQSEFDVKAGGSGTAGGQSQTSEDKFSGNYSLKVADTLGKGNAYWYPSTSADSSRVYLGRKYGIPRGTPLSITFKAKALGTNGWIQPFMAGGPGKSTYPLNHFPQYYPDIKAPIHFTAPVRAGDTSFTVDRIDELNKEFLRRQSQNSLMTLADRSSTNYGIGATYIQRVDVANKRVYVYPNLPFRSSFAAGDDVVSMYWEDNAFIGRSLIANEGWKTYSTNVIVSTDTDMEYETRGMDAIFDTVAPGTVYLDEFKFGYAQLVELYRDGQSLYKGYLSDYEDTGAVDRAAPQVPEHIAATPNKQTRQLELSWNMVSDIGTTYSYQLKGYPRNESATVLSTAQTITVTSGIKGYSVVVDTNPTTQPSGQVTTTANRWSTAMPSIRSYVHIAAVDQQGNVSPAVHIPIVDEDLPTLTVTPSVSDWTTGNVELRAVADDATTWVRQVSTPDRIVSGSAASFTATANGSYTFSAEDSFGHSTQTTYTVSNIDRQAPEISFTPGKREWSAEPAEVKVNISDTQSGIDLDRIRYSWSQNKNIDDEEREWHTSSSSSFTVPITEEGEWYLTVQASDRMGNNVTMSTDYIRLQQMPTTPLLNGRTLSSKQIELEWQQPAMGWTDGLRYELVNETTGQRQELEYPTASYIESELTPGTRQSYRIRALNHTGASNWSEPTVLYTRPDLPEQVSVSLQGKDFTRAQVNIQPVASADAYHITFTDRTTGTITAQQTVTGTTYASVGPLAPNTLYDVAVTAVNAGGEGIAKHASYLSLPAAPFGFDRVAAYEHEIELKWTTVTGAVYADLQRNGQSVSNNTYLSGELEQYRDVELPSGTLFNYELALANTTGFGYFTYLPGIWTLPGRVEALHSSEASDTSQTLQWQPTRGATGYRLYVDGRYSDTVTDTTYTYRELDPGKVYTYTVEAINASGTGTAAILTVTTRPAIPDGIRITDQTEHGFNVHMEPVRGANSYRLQLNQQTYHSSNGTFAITGLQAGNAYRFHVQAGNDAGYSKAVSLQTITLPPAVEGARVKSNEPGQIVLDWQPVQGASYYEISDMTSKLQGIVSQPGYHVKLQPGEWGRTTITPVNDSGRGQAITVDYRAIPDAGDILPEQLVKIGQRGVEDVLIHWDTIPGADEYHLYAPDGSKVATVSGSTYALLSGLDSATRYTNYTLRAVNNGGESRSYPVPAFVTRPDPSFTLSTSDSRHRATITLTAKDGAEQYAISSATGKLLFKGKQRQWEIQSLRADTNYTFLVWSENEAGDRSAPVPVRIHTSRDGQIPGQLGLVSPHNAGSLTSDHSNLDNKADVVVDMYKQNADTKPAETTGTIDFAEDAPVRSDFTDTLNHFAQFEIDQLAALGILKGKTPTTFAPELGVTRSEFMSMLVRLVYSADQMKAEAHNEVASLPFRDVHAQDWYVLELAIAHANGWISGVSKTQFAPDQIITREQAAKILAHALQTVGVSGEVEPAASSVLPATTVADDYTDSEHIADWAMIPVQQLTAAHLLQGYPTGTFQPRKSLNRAEAALMLYRSMNGLLHSRS